MDSDFIGVIRAADRMKSDWNKNRSGKSASSSILGLWREALESRQYTIKLKRVMEEEFSKNVSKYSSGFVQKQRWQMEDVYKERVAEIRKGYDEDVNKFYQNKEMKIDQMITEAPSTQQRNLLESLRMRGKNVTRGELLRVMPIFFNNYASMKILEEIGNNIGVKIHAPVADAMELLERLNDAKEYLIAAGAEFGKSGKPDMRWGPFYYVDPEQPDVSVDSSVMFFSGLFDTVPQLQDDDTDDLTAAETARLNTMFSEVRRLDPDGNGKPEGMNAIKVANLTEKILMDNPDDLPLILKSRYGKYAQLALAVKKARMDAETVTNAAEGKETTE